MWIENLTIRDYRAFKGEHSFEIPLGQGVTAIAGHNGVGKSTILAVLGNCGSLPTKVARPLNGKLFNVELAEVIKYDPGRDSTGVDKVAIQFHPGTDGLVDNLPADGILHFRASLHKTDAMRQSSQGGASPEDDPRSRYRLIPMKKGRPDPNEKKLEWPTYYLGLSRLYPLGETSDYNQVAKQWTPELRNEYLKNYKKVLIGQDEATEVSLTSFSEAPKKTGVGISTSQYGVAANSVGQDNLGQILLGLLSFADLHDRLGDAYRGGLLLVDELEASMHPAAQRRLLTLLFQFSKKYRFQIVFTTHSMTLLDLMLQKTHPENDFARVIYMKRAGGQLFIDAEPSPLTINADLSDQILDMPEMKGVPVYLEDDTARTLFRLLHEKYLSDCPVDIIEGDIGYQNLLQISGILREHFLGSMIILDGDVSPFIGDGRINERQHSKLRDLLRHSDFRLSSNDTQAIGERGLVYLPGREPLETELYCYFEAKGSEHVIYQLPELRAHQVDYAALFDETNLSKKPGAGPELTGPQLHKRWYSRIPSRLRKYFIGAWLESLDKQVIDFFVSEFRETYRQAANQIGLEALSGSNLRTPKRSTDL